MALRSSIEQTATSIPRISAFVGACVQFIVGGNPVKPLDDVQTTEVGLDGNLLAT